MAGKVERHKGFDTKRVAAAFDQLFAGAVPMISELEALREGHKPHPNLESFHHYVSQFEQSGMHYYIRFTAWQYKAEPPQVGISQAHSSFISESYLYEESADISSSAWVPVIDRAMTESSQNAALSDAELAAWLAAGKSKIYAELAPETGEPLASAVTAFLKS